MVIVVEFIAPAKACRHAAMVVALFREENRTFPRGGAITRDAKNKTIVNQDQTKTFALGYDKRVLQDDFNRYPMDFKKLSKKFFNLDKD